MRGRLITLEGSEGAGKSSLMRVIREWLEQRGESVISCREPGGTPTGEAIRRILLDRKRSAMLAHTELLLMFASRAQLVAEVIVPALEAGKTVICDRFADASFAYQGGGRGIPDTEIAELEKMVLGQLQPELTLLLDVPVKLGLKRARRTGKPDRFESERQAFFERVRKAYLRRARQYPERIVVVDASAKQAAVRQQVTAILEQRW